MLFRSNLDRKVTVVGAVVSGLLSGLIVQAIRTLWDMSLFLMFVLQGISILCIAGCFLLWRFFRDPEREAPPVKGAIVSPADGTILYIKRAKNGQIPLSEKNGKQYSLAEFINTDMLHRYGVLVGIGMSFLDVHVNRAPIRGKVIALKHINGIFLSLRKMEAVIRNERQLIVIDDGVLKVGIVQIASRLVRSIVSFVSEGKEVFKGQKIGMIRFGSQVDLYLPETVPLQLNVAEGDKVKAGISVLATYGEIPDP